MQPAFSERYTFVVEANDGARLWVDGVMLFDNFEEVRDYARAACLIPLKRPSILNSSPSFSNSFPIVGGDSFTPWPSIRLEPTL